MCRASVLCVDPERAAAGGSLRFAHIICRSSWGLGKRSSARCLVGAARALLRGRVDTQVIWHKACRSGVLADCAGCEMRWRYACCAAGLLLIRMVPEMVGFGG